VDALARPLWLGLLFLVIGLLVLGQGVVSTHQRRRFRARSVITQAHVLELRQSWLHNTDGPSTIVHTPVVRFALPDGRTVEAATMTGTKPAPARVGDVVDVRYDPDRPTLVDLAHSRAGGLVSCMFVGLGLVFATIGAVLTWLGATHASLR